MRHYIFASKGRQRFTGLGLIVVGVVGTVWEWYSLVEYGYNYTISAFICPFAIVLGFCVLVFPFDVDKLRAEHGVDRPEKWVHYPLAWKLTIVAATVAGLANSLAPWIL